MFQFDEFLKFVLNAVHYFSRTLDHLPRFSYAFNMACSAICFNWTSFPLPVVLYYLLCVYKATQKKPNSIPMGSPLAENLSKPFFPTKFQEFYRSVPKIPPVITDPLKFSFVFQPSLTGIHRRKMWPFSRHTVSIFQMKGKTTTGSLPDFITASHSVDQSIKTHTTHIQNQNPFVVVIKWTPVLVRKNDKFP